MSSDDQPPAPTARDRILADPKIRKVHDYWLSKRTAEHLPSRRDIDPIDIFDCLAGVLLLDVVDDGADYRIRLAGTQVEDAHGGGLKGMLLRDLLGAEPGAADVLDRLHRVVATGEPDFRSAPVVAAGRSFLTFDRVALPLAEDGRRVSQIFCCFAYTPRTRRNRAMP